MSVDRRAGYWQDIGDHDFGQNFSCRNQRHLRRCERSQCQEVAHDAMMRVVGPAAFVLMATRMTARLAANELFLCRSLATNRRLLGAVAMVMMTAVLASALLMVRLRIARRLAILRPRRLAATIAVVVKRRRHRIGEQIARQHDGNRDFPKNGHDQDLNRLNCTNSPILRAYAHARWNAIGILRSDDSKKIDFYQNPLICYPVRCRTEPASQKEEFFPQIASWRGCHARSFCRYSGRVVGLPGAGATAGNGR